MSESPARLWRYGALLLFLGLVNGAFIGVVANPRAALSAHLTAIEGGLILIAFGFLWPKLHLGAGQSRAAFISSVSGSYSLWLALLLAGVLGTSSTTPIAGEGFEGTALSELVVSVLLYLGAAGILLGAGLVLFGLRPARS